MMDAKGMDEDTVTWVRAIEALPVVSLLSMLTKKSGVLVTLRAGLAAESGQNRKNRTFSNLRGLNLCISHIFDLGYLRGQDVVGS